MKKTTFIMGILAAMALSSSYAQNGIYLSIEGGVAQQNGLPSQKSVGATAISSSHSPNAARLGLGYNHDFNSRFGVGLDIGVGQYAKTTYDYAENNQTRITSSAVEFLTTSTLHFPQVDLIAKLGGLRLTPQVSGKNAAEENTQIRLEAALEGAYNFTPRLAATLTYAHVFGDQIPSIEVIGTKTPGLDAVLLGLRYNFGS